VKRALLFDLDETLMVEEPAAEAAFLAAAQLAAADHGVDAEILALGARAQARELWYDAANHGYCLRVGISSWEGLWCRFEGEKSEARALREWAPEYRREAWRLALADQGVDDPRLAERLGERFAEERRARDEVFSEVPGTLKCLKATHLMALVTNGAACLQREKLAASDLAEYFDAWPSTSMP
jgi:putative hydrolase of the HAD superfamily